VLDSLISIAVPALEHEAVDSMLLKPCQSLPLHATFLQLMGGQGLSAGCLLHTMLAHHAEMHREI
jgi:hypothetical protein